MSRGLGLLGRQTVVYGLSGAAAQAVGLITLPVFARALTPAEYGTLEIATVTIALVAILADAGLGPAGSRSYFEYREDQVAERRRVLSTMVITAVLWALVLALVFYLLRGPLGEALFGTAGYATVVALIALSLVLNQLTGFSREILRFRFMPVPYLVSSFISAIVGGLLGVAAVLTLDGGVEDVLWGAAIGLALAAVYGFWKLRGVLAPEVSRPELRRMLAFGLPLIPAALSLWAVSFIDRLLLQHLSSLAVVGEYAIANRVSSVVLFGVTAFGLAFAPFALDLHTRDARQERLIRAQAMNAFVTGLAALAVVLALFAREIVAVVAPAFDTAYRSAGLLCLGVLLYGIATLVMLEMTIVRRTGMIAVAALLATVVNVGANLLLIPPLGAVGAALATAGAYAVMALYAWHRAQRIERVNYDTRFIAELLLVGSACGAAGLLPEGPEWLAAKVAALGVFAAFLWLRGALRPRVLRSVLASLRPSAGEEAA